MDRYFEPIQMGLVPEDALGQLTPEIDKLPLPYRARRMLKLAAPSFKAVGSEIGREVPLFLGLPQLSEHEAPWLKHMTSYLQILTGVRIDRARSGVFPYGRAAGLMALEHALAFVQS